MGKIILLTASLLIGIYWLFLVLTAQSFAGKFASNAPAFFTIILCVPVAYFGYVGYFASKNLNLGILAGGLAATISALFFILASALCVFAYAIIVSTYAIILFPGFLYFGIPLIVVAFLSGLAGAFLGKKLMRAKMK